MEKVSMKMVSNILARVPPLFTDLAKIIAGEIDCSHTTLTTYSTDGSPYTVWPQAVIFPKNTTDIKHVLAFAREYMMPITVRGKGTGGCGGALGEGIILDMSRHFSQIRTVNMMENTVTVDAGVTLDALTTKLRGWHFDIPLLERSDKETTVGALVSTKSSSPSSFHHGTIREWIEAVTVVVDNGEEHILADGITPSGRLLGIYQAIFPIITKEAGTLRAAKPKSHDDGTGYNLWSTSIGPRQLIDQLVGSEGTLGVITSVTFRTSPYKPHTITTCVPVPTKELLATYTDIAKHHHAETIFLYDQTFMQLAHRYHPNLVPFFNETPYVLLVTHGALHKEKVHQMARVFKHALPVEEHLLKTLEGDELIRRITGNDFVLSLCSLYTNSALTPITLADGLIVTIHQVSPFLLQLENYLDSLGKVYCITGNVGSGHISVITLFDPYSQNYSDEVMRYAKTIFSLIKEYDGGISARNGEGLTRTPFIHYAYNDATLLVFKKIKEAWDPLSILNPGKKLGATTGYLTQHFTKPTKQE